MFKSVYIKKLFMNHQVAIMEYDSELYINGNKVVKNTIFIHDRDEYIQIYFDGEYKVYAKYKEIPKNDKEQRVEYLSKILNKM